MSEREREDTAGKEIVQKWWEGGKKRGKEKVCGERGAVR